jgi:hypothetical protein
VTHSEIKNVISSVGPETLCSARSALNASAKFSTQPFAAGDHYALWMGLSDSGQVEPKLR